MILVIEDDTIPPQREHVTPKAIRAHILHYQEAYRAVYGITPRADYHEGYITLQWQDARVTAKRLQQMTQQLKWRLG